MKCFIICHYLNLINKHFNTINTYHFQIIKLAAHFRSPTRLINGVVILLSFNRTNDLFCSYFNVYKGFKSNQTYRATNRGEENNVRLLVQLVGINVLFAKHRTTSSHRGITTGAPPPTSLMYKNWLSILHDSDCQMFSDIELDNW